MNARLAATGVILTPLALLGATFAALGSGPGERTLGAYSTSLNGRMRNQRHNAILALRHLDGAVIPAGGEFSFNRQVGSFNRDSGYRRAPVSFNGQLIDSWGGGVCQASTTTYNAALLAGMSILERNPHQFAPSYVPPGRDAAVSYGEIDLRLRNPYAFPVRIQAKVVGSRLQVQFVGRGRPSRVSVEDEVLTREEPGLIRLGAPSHSARIRNSGKPGYDVVVYRTVDGRRELVSRNFYPSMERVIQYR